MRVAFVTFEYPPFILGGAGIHAAHITEELAKLGHQVVVFTPAIDNTGGAEHPSGANLQVWHVPVREAIPFRVLQFWRSSQFSPDRGLTFRMSLLTNNNFHTSFPSSRRIFHRIMFVTTAVTASPVWNFSSRTLWKRKNVHFRVGVS